MQRPISAVAAGMGWYPCNQGNGLDRVFHALFEHGPAAGLEVSAIVASDPRFATERVHVVDQQMALPQRLRGFRRSFDSLRGSADVVASHFALYASPLLRRIGDRPFVVHFHGPWAAESSAEGQGRAIVAAKRMIEQRVYHRADHLVVLSNAFRDLLVRDFSVPADRVSVIPGGVDRRFYLAPARHDAREQLGWPTDRPVALAVRRLVRRVGLENLVEAARKLRRAHPDILILIGGRGPLDAELRERIEGGKLEHNVRLLGFIPEQDLPTAYAAADVSIVPTAGLEGFGLIAAESLAAGTPVIVTPIGGLPEIVQDLSEELILSDATVGALVDGIAAWLSGKKVLPDRNQCRDYASARFTWDVIAKQTHALYNNLLDGKV